MSAITGLNEVVEDVGHKVVLLGDCSVGKSALILWYVERLISYSGESTIGASVYFKQLSYEGRNFRLDIWDTAGQEKYASLGPIHCRNAEAVVVCYDITNEQSFKNVETWLHHPFIPDNILAVLVGCKSDKNKERVVTKVMGEVKAKSVRPENLQFFETSVVTNTNVDELFDFIASQVICRTTRKHTSGDQRILLDQQLQNTSNSSQCDVC